MKKLLILITLGLLAAGSVSAQPNDNAKAKERIQARLAELKKKLDLTDKQSEQIKAILEQSKVERKENVEKMKSADKSEKPEIRAEMQADNAETRKKILAILTPEQRTKAEEMWQERKEKVRDRIKERRGK
jgi:Spy/CpxP family protein refolding chaperone